MRAIGTGLPFDLRARPARIAFEAAALSSIVLFELLASGLTSASRVPSFACVAISMCALLFVPYLLHMALFGGEESPGREPGACAKLLFPYLLSGAVFLVVVSTVPKAREIAFFTLFLFVCVDRIGIWRALATRADTCESIPGDVSYLHTHHFIPFFMAGVVVGVCAQTALHIGAELGGDVMLALPLALLAVGCCLYLRRRGCVGAGVAVRSHWAPWLRLPWDTGLRALRGSERRTSFLCCGRRLPASAIRLHGGLPFMPLCSVRRPVLR